MTMITQKQQDEEASAMVVAPRQLPEAVTYERVMREEYWYTCPGKLNPDGTRQDCGRRIVSYGSPVYLVENERVKGEGGVPRPMTLEDKLVLRCTKCTPQTEEVQISKRASEFSVVFELIATPMDKGGRGYYDAEKFDESLVKPQPWDVTSVKHKHFRYFGPLIVSVAVHATEPLFANRTIVAVKLLHHGSTWANIDMRKAAYPMAENGSYRHDFVVHLSRSEKEQMNRGKVTMRQRLRLRRKD